MKLCAFADEASNELHGQIDALKRNGFSLLEIRGVDGDNIKDISISKAKEIRKILDSEGISVFSIGSPIGKYPISDDFSAHLDEFCHVTELAEILGATRIRMFSFFPEKGTEPERTKYEAFKRLYRITQNTPSGLILCHENEKEIFGESDTACLEIHKEFSKIRAVFDPANFVQCGVDTEKAWSVLAPYVEYVHVKDARRDGTVTLAGDGEGKVETILKNYISIGGEVVTLEPHLKKFIGLDRLENGSSIKQEDFYKNCDEAFDTAANRLKSILESIERKD